MPSFNKVMMIGNLTRDPQVKNLAGGLVVAEFGLAMNRKYRTANGEDKEEVCFVDCSAFGKQAEVIAQWCKKGKPLFVEGRLRYDQWEDQRAGGAKRSKITVVVENFQFLGSRDDVPTSLFGGADHRSYDSHGRGHAGNGGNGTSRGTQAVDRANPGATAAEHGDRAERPEKPDNAEPPATEKGDKPDRRAAPARGGRAPARQAAEQPFGEEKMFEEADIPF